VGQRLGVVALISAGVSLIVLALLYPVYLGFAVAAAGPLICVAFSGLDATRLACAFLVFAEMAHTLKRFVFVFGEQSQAAYYAIGLGPFFVAAILFWVVFRKRKCPLPKSARWLLAFVAVAGSTTLYRSLEFGAFAGLFSYTAPMMVFFASAYLPDRAVEKLAKTAIWLGCVSVLYGFWQLAMGPTFIDVAWAENTQEFSTEGAKVFDYLHPANSLATDNLFRPYSFHSDPFAWAMSLSAMVALAGMSRSGRGARSNYIAWALAIALVGLPMCLSRSPIIGYLAMIIFSIAIRTRLLRGPASLSLTLVALAIVVVGLGQYLVDNFAFLDLERDSSIESRYLTVGTISARTGAGAFLLDALSEYPLLGAGLGSSATGSTKDTDSVHDELAWSHNIIVDIIFTCGGIGAVLFFGFIYKYLVEIFVMFKRRQDPDAARVGCWALSAVAGFVLTGFASGAVFMSYDFFLVAGVGAGWAMRRRSTPSRVFAGMQVRSATHVRQVIAARQPSSYAG